jgi:hypothetical protein
MSKTTDLHLFTVNTLINHMVFIYLWDSTEVETGPANIEYDKEFPIDSGQPFDTEVT